MEADFPEPVFREHGGGVEVAFLKDIYTEEYLLTLELNERQVKAVLFAKEKGSIKNAEYQQINSVGRSVSTEELQDLNYRNILRKVGTTGRATKYVLVGFGK